MKHISQVIRETGTVERINEMDFEKAEIAQLARDSELAVDVHKVAASEVFGVPYAEVTEEQRIAVKSASFGLLYSYNRWLDPPRTVSIPLTHTLKYLPGSHRFTTNPTYSGPGCAMCGLPEEMHQENKK